VSPTRLLPVVAALAISVTACAAGQGDATSHEHSPRVIDATVGTVRVANVQVVPATGAAPASPSPTDTTSASPGSSASPGTSGSPGVTAQAYLTMSLTSTQDDALTGASITGGGTITPTSGASLEVKHGQVLVIGDPQTSSGAGGPALAISGLSSPPVVGTTIEIMLSFRTAGSVTVQAPVRDSQPV
jgi:hypothetical protein